MLHGAISELNTPFRTKLTDFCCRNRFFQLRKSTFFEATCWHLTTLQGSCAWSIDSSVAMVFFFPKVFGWIFISMMLCQGLRIGGLNTSVVPNDLVYIILLRGPGKGKIYPEYLVLVRRRYLEYFVVAGLSILRAFKNLKPLETIPYWLTTPLKINMEHNHGGSEDHFPF